jgi:hypothetical protein
VEQVPVDVSDIDTVELCSCENEHECEHDEVVVNELVSEDGGVTDFEHVCDSIADFVFVVVNEYVLLGDLEKAEL